MMISEIHQSFIFKVNPAVEQLRWRVRNICKPIYWMNRQRGQILFESLLSFSVFFIFAAGILYFSLLYHTQLWLHHISYENAVCLYYENKQSYKCLMKTKNLIHQTFPYLKDIKVSFQSGLNYKESIIEGYFPFHTQVIARQSFYARY